MPAVKDLFTPLLRVIVDERPHALTDCISALASKFQAPMQFREELAGLARFRNQVKEASQYLARGGLLKYSGDGELSITKKGLSVIKEYTSGNFPIDSAEGLNEWLRLRAGKKRTVKRAILEPATKEPAAGPKHPRLVPGSFEGGKRR